MTPFDGSKPLDVRDPGRLSSEALAALQRLIRGS